jgi:curved DNA-binding protein CbpA
MSQDYYSVLGVRSTAKDREIKKAYRKRAIEFHPDKNHDPNLEELFTARFVQIKAAYDILLDGKRRAEYDKEREDYLAENPVFGRQAYNTTPSRCDNSRSTARDERKFQTSQQSRNRKQAGARKPPHPTAAGRHNPNGNPFGRSRGRPSSEFEWKSSFEDSNTQGRPEDIGQNAHQTNNTPEHPTSENCQAQTKADNVVPPHPSFNQEGVPSNDISSEQCTEGESREPEDGNYGDPMDIDPPSPAKNFAEGANPAQDIPPSSQETEANTATSSATNLEKGTYVKTLFDLDILSIPQPPEELDSTMSYLYRINVEHFLGSFSIFHKISTAFIQEIEPNNCHLQRRAGFARYARRMQEAAKVVEFQNNAVQACSKARNELKRSLLR